MRDACLVPIVHNGSGNGMHQLHLELNKAIYSSLKLRFPVKGIDSTKFAWLMQAG